MRQHGLDPWIEWSNRNKVHPMMKGTAGLGVFDLVGFPKVSKWEEKYLPREYLEKYDQSVGLYDPRLGNGAK